MVFKMTLPIVGGRMRYNKLRQDLALMRVREIEKIYPNYIGTRGWRRMLAKRFRVSEATITSDLKRIKAERGCSCPDCRLTHEHTIPARIKPKRRKPDPVAVALGKKEPEPRIGMAEVAVQTSRWRTFR